MNDDIETPPAEDADTPESGSQPAVQAPKWKARLRKWLIIGGVLVVVVPIVSLVLWTWIAVNWKYSSGDRAGYVQKFSEKGWLCSTWEGELSMVNLPGAVPEIWSFSVRDELTANSVRGSIGKKVILEYEEHRGVPTSCFGETRYFVVGVRQVSGP